MWTPPQWRPGFLAVFLVTLGMCVVFGWAYAHQDDLMIGVAGGILVGLYLSLAWTVRQQVWPLSAALATSVIPLVTLLGLLDAELLFPEFLTALVVFSLWFGFYEYIVTRRVNAEVVKEIVSLGTARPSGRALIVYHPGLGGFQAALQRTIAESLNARGWRVDLVTAHRSAPTDLADVDLLVLGAPVYNFQPARPLLDYLKRLGPLAGKHAVLVLTGGGMTDVAMRHLRRLVEGAGGQVVGAYELWMQRSNREHYDIEDPIEIIRRAANGFAPPPPKSPTSGVHRA